VIRIKRFYWLLIGFLFLWGGVPSAFAHVIVRPAEVGVAAFQTFTIGVPNERENPTVGVKLLIPKGVAHVSPNVKPGWNIEIKRTGSGEDALVTEIDWMGGSIPVGQRDDFLFSAQVPAEETTLQWKAYQTYSDGTVVSWDQSPDTKLSEVEQEKRERENLGSYSQTDVINDLATSKKSVAVESDLPSRNDKLPTVLSVVALVLSVMSFAMQVRKK
jgi:uncharacterized protein YcnI